jgi:predicted nucleic acid-binding protein
VYLDTPYIAKFCFNEPESPRVRKLVREADAIYSSLWSLAEFHAVIHRRIREGASSPSGALDLASRFSAPRDIFLRTADAVHLATASEIGEREVWTNDRHMLAAASYFGVTGRSV